VAARKPDMKVYGKSLMKKSDDRTKSWWKQIGVAWENGDGSISVNLDFVPNDGQLVLWTNDDKRRPPSFDEVPLPPDEDLRK
jgi:hypothetical protein